MKTTLKVLAVLFTVITISSCGSKGVDQATKDAIAKFDTDWAAMMTSANAFTTTLQAAIDKMTADHAAMAEATAGLTETQMATLKPDMDVCMKTETDANAMMAEASQAILDWTAAGGEWAAWKTEVADGKVKQDDATTKLGEWNTKLADANTAITRWNDSWMAMNDAHMAAEANAAALMEGMNKGGGKPTKDDDKNDDGKLDVKGDQNDNKLDVKKKDDGKRLDVGTKP